MANRKPPSGREGDREAVEGERVAMEQNSFHCNAFSLSQLRCQLPPGGSLTAHICAVNPTDKSKFERFRRDVKLQFRGEDALYESLPCVKGGGSRSETEGL